jgi:choline dehydrogenase-like flavoprotein
MLDAGRELEPERRTVVNRLQNAKPEQWSECDVRTIKGEMAATAAGVTRKLAYGSGFPYEPVDPSLESESREVDVCASYARGGFSNVWGAAVLPFLERDIGAWPIGIAELAPHYRAVLDFMDVAAGRDELETVFPLYGQTRPPLRPSRQATTFLRHLRLNRSALRSRGVAFGAARLAVRSALNGNGDGCSYCGLCMYGCPSNCIYNAADTLGSLQENPRFSYVPGVIVRRINEANSQIVIESRNGTFVGSHAYLACGVLSSTRILLSSLDAYDEEVTLRDSQYFIFPLVRYRGTSDVETEKLFTLSQVFLELFDKTVCPNTVHLQVYTYNDLYPGVIRKALGRFQHWFKSLVPSVLGRLLVVQGYLHSDLSPTVSIRLERGGRTGDKLVLEGNTPAVSRRTVAAVCRKLWACQRFLGAVPVQKMLLQAGPGRGFHCGGTFPMRTTPDRLETDILGRPTGFRRLHVVDATTFPSIPAAPITYTVMANAHRIACGQHDR